MGKHINHQVQASISKESTSKHQLTDQLPVAICGNHQQLHPLDDGDTKLVIQGGVLLLGSL
jgi:hypothetical protein